jgi:hypothetical protein
MWRRAFRAICVVLLAFTIAGCSFPSDYFGNRAVEYNREAEDATLSAMLLNIVRASQRRPMQFTGLQSVTGSSSTSGSITGSDQRVHNTPGSTLPAVVNASSSLLDRVITTAGNATASISGGPTFIVPVLDTQEFYQGILTPIPLSTIDFYIQEGFPPELLADLFILDIVVTRIDDGSCQQFTFRNNVSDDLAFGQFQAMVDYLVASGYVAERVSKSTPYGPPLPLPRTADAARAVDAYAHAAQAGLDVKAEKSGKTTKYVLQKKASELRSCFIYKGGDYPSWLKAKDVSIFCGNSNVKVPGAKSPSEGGEASGGSCTPRKKNATGKAAPEKPVEAGQGSTAHGQSEFSGIALAPQVLQRIAALQEEQKALKDNQIANDSLFPVPKFKDAHISMKFQTRSTEGILYYLGELVRRNLAPEDTTSRIIRSKAGLNYGTYPMRDCVGPEDITEVVALSNLPQYQADAQLKVHCQNIFVVNQGPSFGSNVVSVMYNGSLYSVPHDPSTGDRSSQVMELAKQILNLNTSAKQLPSTTVISVVGGG